MKLDEPHRARHRRRQGHGPRHLPHAGAGRARTSCWPRATFRRSRRSRARSRSWGGAPSSFPATSPTRPRWQRWCAKTRETFGAHRHPGQRRGRDRAHRDARAGHPGGGLSLRARGQHRRHVPADQARAARHDRAEATARSSTSAARRGCAATSTARRTRRRSGRCAASRARWRSRSGLTTSTSTRCTRASWRATAWTSSAARRRRSAAWTPERVYQEYVDEMALRRVTVSQDIANAVLFLVSDESKNMTGQSVTVDGGWDV